MELKCAICGNNMDRNAVRRTFRYKYNDQVYRLYRCPACGLDQWYPLEFYPEFYKEQLPEHEILSMGYREPHLAAKMFLNNFQDRPGKLLDIGCGEGAFLGAAKEIGFEVCGIDLDEKGIRAAKEVRQIGNVRTEYLKDFAEKISTPAQKFDYVTIYEVLEHQTQPKEFMGDVKKCLKEGGLLAGSVPNRERPFPGVHEPAVLGDYPPAHFTRWSKGTLVNFLKNEGFDQILCRPIGFEKVSDVVGWLRSNIFMLFAQKAKYLILGDRKKASMSVSDLSKRGGSRNLWLLRSLKYVVDAVLFFPALLLWPVFRKKGFHLYFQAEYKGG